MEVLLKEIKLRHNYLDKATVSTIYFGGGTPSLLTNKHLNQIFSCLSQYFAITNDCEITLEANPDDLSVEYLNIVAESIINRLSIGIQTFNDEHLIFLNRRHDGQQAIQTVANARKAGINNISVDLIYGIPGQSIEDWQRQLKTALDLSPEHISAYGLTFEPGTVLFSLKQKSKVTEQNEDDMIQMYAVLLEQIKKTGYEAYEISNFCKPGYRSGHNSSYWKFLPYLGLGPSAHSFNGNSRQWNISSLQQYFSGVESEGIFYEKEDLTSNDLYNEYVMVSLRTMEGVDILKLEQLFGDECKQYFLKNARHYVSLNLLIIDSEKARLTESGIQLSNLIITEMMMTK